MNYTYHMPTKVFSGNHCIIENSHVLKSFGNKAMLVTGRSSAKKNGSQDDVVAALEKQGIEYVVFDQVMANPTVACTYEGAAFAKANQVDFIVAIGGGSPMDAAKAMALLAKQDVAEADLFNGQYSEDVLPVIAVPTTAGTGSEVTQYSILTNDAAETKTSIVSDIIFPKVAFVDARYMLGLPVTTTVNTAVDALSHAIEGMLSIRASLVSDALAKESIRFFVKAAPLMCEAVARNDASVLDERVRNDLMQCAMLAGMVIAQTGTTAVHAMGYSLTYFKDIDHGRANGLLLAEYMAVVQESEPQLITDILSALGMTELGQFKALLNQLLGAAEVLTQAEVLKYTAKAVTVKSIEGNCKVKPSEDEVKSMFMEAFHLS
ncbi:1,3-propanediol dehydrogenase [Vibrio aerogenes CECT 7868]|uniref:1,3-propanediol dehydrogenase n=1 Tax=Vibrio aerogenes CECT 7868 TaxID=1216006 RepID=A0A1M6ETU1_9VIBR|nr:iron-containing alcohol dehydrogenase family protein [Vibrio aerogenes]SHI88855.1 1,3-propanediol dehydrogenase [Vibrio aerogenes CECT 7868]